MEKLQAEMKDQELQLEDVDAARRKITVSEEGCMKRMFVCVHVCVCVCVCVCVNELISNSRRKIISQVRGKS